MKKLSLTFVCLLLCFSFSKIGETKSVKNLLKETIKTLDREVVESRQRPPEPPPPPEQPNRPPHMPSNPNPFDGARNVGTYSVVLKWTGGDPDGDPVTYTIKVYNDGQVEFSSESSSCNVTIPSLKGSVSYSWQVTATDVKGSSTEGQIWSFITRAPEPPQPPPQEWKVIQTLGDYQLLQKNEKTIIENKIYFIDTLGIYKGEGPITHIGSHTYGPYEEWQLPLLCPISFEAILEKEKEILYLMWYRHVGEEKKERLFQVSKDEGKTWERKQLLKFKDIWPLTYGPIKHTLFFQKDNTIQYVWTNNSTGIYIYSSYNGGIDWDAKFILNYNDYDSAENHNHELPCFFHGRQILEVIFDENNILIKAKIIPDDKGLTIFYLISPDQGRTWELKR